MAYYPYISDHIQPLYCACVPTNLPYKSHTSTRITHHPQHTIIYTYLPIASLPKSKLLIKEKNHIYISPPANYKLFSSTYCFIIILNLIKDCVGFLKNLTRDVWMSLCGDVRGLVVDGFRKSRDRSNLEKVIRHDMT